jgi:sec-independent protein translocase protein TatB
MFDLGIQELIVIFIVALLVFGPKRLPDIARAIGKGLAEIRNAMEGVKTQIDSEMREVKEIRDLADPIALKNELFKSESLIKPIGEPLKPDEVKPVDALVAVKKERKPVKKAALRKKKSMEPARAKKSVVTKKISGTPKVRHK